MATKELSYKESEALRIKRSHKMLKEFRDYLEFRRYPKLHLIAKDSGVSHISLSRFLNERATLSNKNMDKLEAFMKDN